MVVVARGVASESRLALDPEVAEVSLLLPCWQVSALEKQAHALGLTLAQFMRRVLAEAICRPQAAATRRIE